MNLKEYKDSKGNPVGKTSGQAVSNTGNTSTGSSSTGYEKRFKKLLMFAIKHKKPSVDKLVANNITEDTLEFTEFEKDGSTRAFKIYIGATTEAWRIRTYINNDSTPVNDWSGMGWIELLKQLRYYITVPVTGTPEYNNLLTEWLDSKGKTVHINNSPTPSKSSSTPVGKIPDQTYRYKRLLAQIDADGFCKYTINLLNERTLDITLHNGVEVKLERNDHFPIYTLTVEDTSQSFDDYEDVLDALIIEGIIGDTDLCESVALKEFVDKNGNKVTIPKAPTSSQPASSNPNKSKDKFYDLISYMQKNKYSIVTSTKVDRLDNTGFEYEEHREPAKAAAYDLKVKVDLGKHDLFTIRVFQDGKQTVTYMPKGWENFLLYLRSLFNVPATGSPEHTALIESMTDTFEVYDFFLD
jgi:hypothetical protein